MAVIEVTKEISRRLKRLSNVIEFSNVDFDRMCQVEFQDNIDFSSIDTYREIIRMTGNLANRYSRILVSDIQACEQMIESIRERDTNIARIIGR